MAINIRKRGSDDDSPDSDRPNEASDQPGQKADSFQQATLRGATWMEANRNRVIGAAVAVVVIALGAWGASAYVDHQEVAASDSLSPALWDYGTLIEGSAEMKQIAKSDAVDAPDKTFPSDEARWQAIYKRASSALEDHQSGAIAQSARLTKAGAAVHLEKYEDAVSSYQAYLDGPTQDAMLPFVYVGLATAWGARGDVDKAAANYDKLVEENEAYAPLAMYEKAQVYDSAGQTDKARELYQEILEAHPKTPHRDDIERRLALL